MPCNTISPSHRAHHQFGGQEPGGAEEIGAVLLQSAVYCGVPAANSAFAVAQRVLAEEESGQG